MFLLAKSDAGQRGFRPCLIASHPWSLIHGHQFPSLELGKALAELGSRLHDCTALCLIASKDFSDLPASSRAYDENTAQSNTMSSASVAGSGALSGSIGWIPDGCMAGVGSADPSGGELELGGVC